MMAPLADDLRTQKHFLEEFRQVTERILNNMTDMIDESIKYENYKLCSSTTAGTRRTIRPLNTTLFIENSNLFNDSFEKLEKIISELKKGNRNLRQDELILIDKVIYTMQQSLGIGFDLLVEANSARKHVGNRFEELIRSILTSLKVV